jgi:hypothetical protein
MASGKRATCKLRCLCGGREGEQFNEEKTTDKIFMIPQFVQNKTWA